MREPTQSISTSKGHLTDIALVGFLLRVSAFVIGEFGTVPKRFATVPARERKDCEL